MSVWSGGGLQLLADTFYSTGTGNKRRFAEQINAIIMAERGNKVISGCVPIVGGQTNLPTAGTHLVIGSGNVLVGGVKLSFAGANIDLKSVHDALGVGQARYVLITIYDNASTATARATASNVVTDGQQEPTTFPKDEAAIALIYLEEADETMDLNNIGELFMPVPGGDYIAGDGEITGDFDISGHDLFTVGLKLAGVLITASASELNLLDGKAFGIADNNIVEIDHAAVADNDYAKFTANGLEGRSFAEVQTDLTIVSGIAATNVPRLEGTLADDDYLKLTATGTEGRSFSEVLGDIGAQPIDDFLTDLSGLTQATNKIPYMDSATTAALLDFQDDDTMAAATATAVGSTESIKAYIDAIELIGSANAEYINCEFPHLSNATIPETAYWFAGAGNGLHNIDGTNFTSLWRLTGITYEKAGLFLYVAGCKITFENANGTNFVTSRTIWGMYGQGDPSDTLDTDTSIITTAGIDTDTFTAVKIGGVYQSVMVSLAHVVATAFNLKVSSVELLCYYE